MKRILVAEDEEAIRELYSEEMRAAGYEVFTACSGEKAITMVEAVNPDLVTLDIRLEGIDGVEVLRRIKDKRRDLAVVICSAYPSYKRDFGTWAADAYIVKSSDVRELMAAVAKALAVKDQTVSAPLPAEHGDAW